MNHSKLIVEGSKELALSGPGIGCLSGKRELSQRGESGFLKKNLDLPENYLYRFWTGAVSRYSLSLGF